MKNFVLLGRLWKHAAEFANEASADQYIAQHCQGIDYEKCSKDEVESRFSGFKQKHFNLDESQNDIRSVTTVYEYKNAA